jgi:hypothetical protein
MSSSSSSNHVARVPYHVLMSPSPTAAACPELQDRRIANDYLARRAEAHNTPQTDLWSAALPIERALAECCELDGDESLEVVVEGALMLKKVIPFVELLAKYCYKPTTRILVVSILERTLEQDESNRLEDQRDKNNDTSKKQRPNCFSRFLAAGGLKILNQWLLDAMTPVTVGKQQRPPKQQEQAAKKPKNSPHGCTKADETDLVVTSSDGPLLMPLLEILERMPLDRPLITSTKINKTIRKLEKQLGELPKKLTDPLAGGYIVQDVLKTIESIKVIWRNKDNSSPNGLGNAKDPFRKLQQTIAERLQVLKEYDAGRSEKPAWLEHFENVEKVAKEKKELSKMTPDERKRKFALLDIQQKRQEADRKMEELLAKKRMAISQTRKPKKTVRWRDGKDHGKGVQMEDIFHYPRGDESTDDHQQEQPQDSDDEDMWN